ncbi:MAG: response regulator [Calditrichaceae bacterium]|jgi:two-component system, cell cycle sensor histidine kinase and response regulator CckA
MDYASFTKPTVLIIDEEFNHQNNLKEIFDMLGFNTLTVNRNKEGVNLFTTYNDNIDLVFVHNTEPEKNGTSTLKKLKKVDPEIKILCMNEYKHEVDTEDQDFNNIGFIDTPVTMEHLIKGLNDVTK